MPYGTLAVPDLIRSANANVAEFGENQLFAYIDQMLTAHNRITAEQLDQLVDTTTERILGYGGSSGVVMVKTNEFGRADASKPTAGGQVGLPLELTEATVQWTRKWMQNHRPMELVVLARDVMLQDTQQIQKDLKTALFTSTNRTFIDALVDRLSLSVKALANADSFALPPGPNAEAFNGATHTHYLARAGGALAATDLDALVLTVKEHFNRGTVVLYINSAQEAAIRAFTAANQFVPLTPVQFIPATTAVAATNPAYDTADIYNRQIGFWGSNAAPVFIKPWIPANYILALLRGGPRKPLARRVRPGTDGGLAVAADNEQYPLRAETWEREHGFGVQDRLSAAVLFAGNTVYADPVF